MASDRLLLDVFVHGAGVHRDAEVRRQEDGIRYGEWFVPWREVLWISRRSGMILVFSENVSLAIRAAGGELGELEVVEYVPCPNCAKPLMQLPKNYPLYDLQCTGCSLRAQVKTVHSRPKGEILGAGWDIHDKVLKSGFLIPPLFVNFKWPRSAPRSQRILFFPFVPRSNVKMYQLSGHARRANYKMFRYTGLTGLPHFVVYEKLDETGR